MQIGFTCFLKTINSKIDIINIMTPEEKELLEKTHLLAEENNKILVGIRRANRWGIAYKVLYWVVVLAVSYGAYVYIQPFVDQIVDSYKSIMGTTNEVKEATGKISDLNGIIDSLKL